MIPTEDLKLMAVAAPSRAVRIMAITLLNERSHGKLLSRLEKMTEKKGLRNEGDRISRMEETSAG